MPNDRELKLDSEFEAETDSEKWRHIKIKYHGIDSSVVMVPPEELGCMFNFEYIPRLMFLHEKDLRTISFNCSSPTESYCTLNVTGNGELNTDCCGPVRLDVCNGCFNSDISIRRIGVVGGIDVGCGVFADIDMNLGTFIGEYVGLVTSSSTSNNSIDDGSYSFLYPSLDGGFEINALQYGNAMRFVNHSVRPNAAFRRIFLGGILHIAVVSKSAVVFTPQSSSHMIC
jgi:hypothetical protein